MSGLEPPTVRLRIECSTTELHRHCQLLSISQMMGPNSNNSHYSPLMPRSFNQKLLPLLSQQDAEKYARLQIKAQVAYKSLRQFFYIAFSA